MSPSSLKRKTALDLLAQKGQRPIASLTAYHAHTARIIDPLVDFILVGDSLGMVMHGLETTLPVTLDMMILQGKAVMRSSCQALVVVDMPFGSYEADKKTAFENAARIIKQTGCGAIKMEGGARMAETIRFLVERGIPVMAHIGLTPQSFNTMGGFRVQGRTQEEWETHEQDARAVTDAGAFAVVLEGMAEPLAAKITQQIAIPTIGIGASPQCDGQILVLEDMLGLSEWAPKFVREYGSLRDHIKQAVKAYVDDVRTRQFPSHEHLYQVKK